MYTCPHCHKNIKDLKSHIKSMHPDKVVIVDNLDTKESKNVDNLSTEARVKTQRLEIKKPPAKEDTTKEPEPGYHCVECGSELDGKPKSCPNCGAQLDWSQV